MSSFEYLWEKYGDKTTTMQYPYDSSGTNRLFDGQVHEITPHEIVSIVIGGREFSALRYHDITMDTDAVTLLTKIGDTLAKVPLDNYNFLFDYLDKNRIFTNEDTILDLPPIKLAQTMNAQELISLAESNIASMDNNPPNGPRVATSGANPPSPPSGANPPSPPNGPRVATSGANPPDPPKTNTNFIEYEPPILSRFDRTKPKPIFKFKEYVPLSGNRTGKARGGSFSSAGVVIDPYTDEEIYEFNKAPSFPEKDQGIQSGINSLPNNMSGVHKYRFRVDVREGMTGREYCVDSEGRVMSQLVLLIPGTHEYTIAYAPCKYSEDYTASKQANTMLIHANWSDYRDIHDRDRAFYDGCRRILSMDFYDGNGKRLADAVKSQGQGRK